MTDSREKETISINQFPTLFIDCCFQSIKLGTELVRTCGLAEKAHNMQYPHNPASYTESPSNSSLVCHFYFHFHINYFEKVMNPSRLSPTVG